MAVGGLFLYQNFQTKPASQPTSTPKVVKTSPPTSSPVAKTDPCEVLTNGNIDVPPLYEEGVTWQQPRISEYEAPLGSDIESRVINGCLIKSVTSDESAIKVRNYYLEKLTAASWKMIVQGDAPFGGLGK